MLPPELELPLLEPEFCSLSVSMVTGSWELRLGSTPDLNRKIWKLSQARERAKLYFTALHSFFFTGISQYQASSTALLHQRGLGVLGAKITHKYSQFKSSVTTV